MTQKDKKMPKGKCIFWKDWECNSDYGQGLSCDGESVIPEECPYNKSIQLGDCPYKKEGGFKNGTKD